MTAAASDWLVWQLADSAFPTGGFAHSGGLESAWQHGQVRNRAQLHEFLAAARKQLVKASLPFVAAAFDGPPAPVDELCEAFTNNHVANRASRLQGRALIATIERSFGRAAAIPSLPLGHFAPACGTIFAALGLERATALRLFVFIQLRGWISSAIRLNIVGPLEAQAIQAQLSSDTEIQLRDASLSLDEVIQTAPILEIYHASHDRLYSRLFQS